MEFVKSHTSDTYLKLLSDTNFSILAKPILQGALVLHCPS